HLDWYLAYNAFRLACILQGIAGRVRDGTAASAHATRMVARMPGLVAATHDLAIKAGMR
ncbi:MAG: phosphotransferase family protein, partial [Gammaproteobacteria bacterium]